MFRSGYFGWLLIRLVGFRNGLILWEIVRVRVLCAEAALDGLYIIRTSVKTERMDAPTCVRTYKSLAQVERAFRSMKTMDLKVRPIHHHLEGRVRAHIPSFCACWPTMWSGTFRRLGAN